MNKKNNDIPLKTKIMSLFLLFIMVASVAGFAFMMAGPGFSPVGAGQGQNQLPDNLPLQEVEYEGENFWVTIKNSELFVFDSIDNFINDIGAESIADRLQFHRQVFIYVEPDFVSSESVFILERALSALGINYERIANPQCSPDTVIFSRTGGFDGECMVFDANNSVDAYRQAESVVYHLVND